MFVMPKRLDGSVCSWYRDGPRPKRHRVRWRTSSPSPKRGKTPIFGPCLLCSNDWMDQDATWYGGRPRHKRHCARWGPSSPSPKSGQSPLQFSAHVYCGQTAAWTKMPLGMEVCLGPGHIVLDGDQAQLPKLQPPFSAHVYCGQTTGWIKMPLGMMVGLGPGNIVLDADPAPPQGAQLAPPPKKKIRPMSVVAKRLDGSRCHLVRR